MMEEECIKICAPPNIEFVAKEYEARGKRPNLRKKPKKGPHPYRNSFSKVGSTRKHKAKGTGVKDMAHVKCYNS